MDGTTWGGFTGTDPSGHNWYGTQNVYGPQYDYNNPQYNPTWSLDQFSVPSHSHAEVTFQIQLSSTEGGSLAPSGTLTLSGPMGSFVVPIDPSSPGYTPSYTQTTSQFTGSCANGYISISGPDTSTNADYTLSCSEGWGVAVVTGSVSDGTYDGANSSSIPICIRGGQDTQQTFGLDSPATTATDVFFETNNLPVDAPAGQEQWNTDYSISGATLVGSNGNMGNIYRITIPAGQTQSGAVTFHAICPYTGGPETGEKDVAISLISDPNPASNVIAAQPVNAGPLFNVFGFTIGVLLISEHVNGELTQSQMDNYITLMGDPSQDVRHQAVVDLSSALGRTPSQYDHDYLYQAWTQAQDPQVKTNIWNVFVAVGWTDDKLSPAPNVGPQYLWNDDWTLRPVNIPSGANPLLNYDFRCDMRALNNDVLELGNLKDKSSTQTDVQCPPAGYGQPVYLCAQAAGIGRLFVQLIETDATGNELADNMQSTFVTVTQV